MAGRPIKRWNTDPGSSPEPELIYAEKSVGPDYVYGDEAIASFREELGLSAVPKQKESRSGVVREVHKCQRPPTSRHGVGTVYYCEDCDRYSVLEKYLPSRGARQYRFRWVIPGFFAQSRLARRHG